MIKKVLFAFFVVFCCVGEVLAFPHLTGPVVDEAKILTRAQKDELEHLLQNVSPYQVVAVSLKSLDGMEIEEYGYQLGRHWGIGQKGVDNGVLVIIAPEQRQLRIEVGYGLEGVLTDAKTSLIVNNTMLPYARQKQYAQSLIYGVKEVLSLLGYHERARASSMPSSTTSSKPAYERPPALFFGCSFLGLFLLLFGFNFVSKLCKNAKTSRFQNKVMFVCSYLFIAGFVNLFVSFVSIVSVKAYLVAIAVALVFVAINAVKKWRKNPDFPYRGNMQVGKPTTGYLKRTRSNSSRRYSGGGGSFGGGGASGRW